MFLTWMSHVERQNSYSKILYGVGISLLTALLFLFDVIVFLLLLLLDDDDDI